MALPANEELPLVHMPGMAAADKGVERGDAVHQAVFQEEIQRPVDGGRRGTAAVFLAQHAEDVVGAQRPVALPDQLQHTLAQGSQAQPLLQAELLGLLKRVADTMAMVMRLASQLGMGSEAVMGDGGDGNGEETLFYYALQPDEALVRCWCLPLPPFCLACCSV